MAITLKQLRYLTTLQDERHFGRAASRLHVTQPTLSQQLRQLEATLGTTLVERGPPASLTPIGRGVAARRNQRYTLKGPKAVHDAGSASTGFFTTALRPKPPAQTPRARRRPPNWPQTSKVFAPTTVAHGEHRTRPS